jgi:phytanoyl-CoA hydroxylase
MIDHVDETNDPLMVIPDSHLGPIFDHQVDGVFCGAMDPARGEVGCGAVVRLTDNVGSITIHHAGTVHGFPTNTLEPARHLLLHQNHANDAWLMRGLRLTSFDDYRAISLCDEDTLEPRVTRVRLPLAALARHQGSIHVVASGPPVLASR